MDPKSVYQTLYEGHILSVISSAQLACREESPSTLIENHVSAFFSLIEEGNYTSLEWRREHMMSQSAYLCKLKTNRTCLYCLLLAPNHPLSCGHSICDLCAQRFGEPAVDMEYHFTMQQCFLCLSRAPLTIDLVPPTKNVNILTIDGGGVRGVIPLEFLLLIQEELGRDCRLQNLIDLALGTSSGKISFPPTSTC